MISQNVGPIEECQSNRENLIRKKAIQREIMQRECFNLLKLGDGLDPKDYVQRTSEGPRCLE